MSHRGVAARRAWTEGMEGSTGLPDARLKVRHRQLLQELEAGPAEAFSSGMLTSAEQEAAYRFIRNKRVDHEAVLSEVVEDVAAKAREAGDVLVVHDTSEISHESARREGGFGPLGSKRNGYLAHTSFVISEVTGAPLGPIGMEPVVRDPAIKRARDKMTPQQWSRSTQRESLRWIRGISRSVSRLGEDVSMIHVMDRETDTYETFATLVEREQEFVLRMNHNRQLDNDPRKVAEYLASHPVRFTRRVRLSKREGKTAPQGRKKHPPRDARTVTLEARAAPVRIARTTNADPALPAHVEAQVVRVTEPNPPKGSQPVTWTLLTTLPIETTEDVRRIVDIYCRRWLIEEFFKAIKTGCAFEDRRYESLRTSTNALALIMPLAVQMLQLRFLDRHGDDVPAVVILGEFRVEMLRAIAKDKLDRRVRLSKNPTAPEAARAIAALGGHMSSNGKPGWQVLHRGWHRLLGMEEGARFALELRENPPPKAAGPRELLISGDAIN